MCVCEVSWRGSITIRKPNKTKQKKKTFGEKKKRRRSIIVVVYDATVKKHTAA
jgi:hypothetical protein